VSTAIRTRNFWFAPTKKVEPASNRTHSLHLMGMIRDALALAELGLEEIDGFAVTIGPGSFTGLRIGISTAKGLAFAAGKLRWQKFRPCRKPEPGKEFFATGSGLLRRGAGDERREFDVVGGGQIFDQIEGLEDKSDASAA